jgi:tRNA U34 5-carboxymethylaminomethyl modifying GTPase MnmE/TrmE
MRKILAIVGALIAGGLGIIMISGSQAHAYPVN